MLYTAVAIGFAGSLHCVGMCSPLAYAIERISPHVVFNRLLYHAGRIFTYGVLGAIISAVGFAFPISRYQNVLSLALGSILIFLSIFSFTKIKIKSVNIFFSRIAASLKNVFAIFLKKKNYGSVFLLGVINGLLPCGLTLLALTYCVVLSSPQQGFLFMIAFGAGTLPTVVGFSRVMLSLIAYFKFSPQRITNLLFFVSGLLLVVRAEVMPTNSPLKPMREVICKTLHY